MFSIHFTGDVHPYDPASGDFSPHRWVHTVLAEAEERWEAPLHYWRESDYEAQWRDGAERIVSGAEVSCLVTISNEPNDAQILQWWELYRLGDEVAVHEALWIASELGPLDPAAAYDALDNKYGATTDDGTSVSEWRLPVNDFKDWLQAQVT